MTTDCMTVAVQSYIAHDGSVPATAGVIRWNGLLTCDIRSHVVDLTVTRRLQLYESSNFAIS
jgi:hypothetical protein